MSQLDKVKWIDFPSVRDARGVLTAVEGGLDIPFDIQRIFYVHHPLTDRGGHAHRDTDQVVTAMAGSFKLRLSDGVRWVTYELNDVTRGLYIPRMVYIEIKDMTPEAVCFVLASTHYDIARSYRSWEDYLAAVRKAGEREP